MGNTKVKLLKHRSALTALVLVVALVAPQFGNYASTVYAAAPSPKAVSNTSNSMEVSPLRTDVTANPGESKTITVTVKNLSDSTVEFKAIENDFVAGDENGKPAIILDENSYAPVHSLKRFMMPIPNVTVQPRTTQAVKLTINVSPSAQAGGYFGALRFAPAGKGDQPVSLSSSVASLVLLTVPGDFTEKLLLTNFDIQQKGRTSGNFRTPDNLNLLLRFQNEGNVQLAPFGQVQVLKGKQMLYKYDFNQKDPKDMVLPDSARRWEVPLEKLGKFGKYTVSATFGYGTGKSIQVSKDVWIIPTSYIFGAIGGILLLIIIIVIFRLFLKSYKKRVLRSSRYR